MATGGVPSSSDNSFLKEKQIVQSLVDLTYIPGHSLPRTIIENANYIFVQESEAIKDILKTKTLPVLLKIRTALRKRAKDIAPFHILKQASKSGKKSRSLLIS